MLLQKINVFIFLCKRPIEDDTFFERDRNVSEHLILFICTGTSEICLCL